MRMMIFLKALIQRLYFADAKLAVKMWFVFFFSAGVGRTGTFIALDALYHYGKRGGNIDIPAFVNKMRQARMNMIQTLVRRLSQTQQPDIDRN